MVDTTRKTRLTLGLLLLIPVGLVSVFFSGILVMGSAGCGHARSGPICSASVQVWVMALPAVGALLGIVAGVVLGMRAIRQDRPIGNSVLMGYLVFGVAEVTAIVLGTVA